MSIMAYCWTGCGCFLFVFVSSQKGHAARRAAGLVFVVLIMIVMTGGGQGHAPLLDAVGVMTGGVHGGRFLLDVFHQILVFGNQGLANGFAIGRTPTFSFGRTHINRIFNDSAGSLACGGGLAALAVVRAGSFGLVLIITGDGLFGTLLFVGVVVGCSTRFFAVIVAVAVAHKAHAIGGTAIRWFGKIANFNVHIFAGGNSSPVLAGIFLQVLEAIFLQVLEAATQKTHSVGRAATGFGRRGSTKINLFFLFRFLL